MVAKLLVVNLPPRGEDPAFSGTSGQFVQNPYMAWALHWRFPLKLDDAFLPFDWIALWVCPVKGGFICWNLILGGGAR